MSLSYVYAYFERPHYKWLMENTNNVWKGLHARLSWLLLSLSTMCTMGTGSEWTKLITINQLFLPWKVVVREAFLQSPLLFHECLSGNMVSENNDRYVWQDGKTIVLLDPPHNKNITSILSENISRMPQFIQTCKMEHQTRQSCLLAT